MQKWESGRFLNQFSRLNYNQHISFRKGIAVFPPISSETRGNGAWLEHLMCSESTVFSIFHVLISFPFYLFLLGSVWLRCRGVIICVMQPARQHFRDRWLCRCLSRKKILPVNIDLKYLAGDTCIIPQTYKRLAPIVSFICINTCTHSSVSQRCST